MCAEFFGGRFPEEMDESERDKYRIYCAYYLVKEKRRMEWDAKLAGAKGF